MSKAFTKEDDVPEPAFVPPRAPLPDDVVNYVTPHGLALLHAELHELEEARLALLADPPEQSAAQRELQQRLQQLEERLQTAVLVDPAAQPHDEVRFGARVTVQGEHTRRLEIVGVDEADAAHGKIAFVAPLAQALLGKRQGESFSFRTPRGEEELEVVSIAYG
jgi:transcription elongation factor GreB